MTSLILVEGSLRKLRHPSHDERAQALCANFVLQATNTQGLGTKLINTRAHTHTHTHKHEVFPPPPPTTTKKPSNNNNNNNNNKTTRSNLCMCKYTHLLWLSFLAEDFQHSSAFAFEFSVSVWFQIEGLYISLHCWTLRWQPRRGLHHCLVKIPKELVVQCRSQTAQLHLSTDVSFRVCTCVDTLCHHLRAGPWM